MPLPTFGGNVPWIVELDVFDETGGEKTFTAQLASNSTEATAISNADALVDAVEAIQPPNCILGGRLIKPIVAIATPDPEAQVRKQLKIGFATVDGNISFAVFCPAKRSASNALLISDRGLLIETNPEFIVLKNLLGGGLWLAPDGNAPTAYNGAIYEPEPGKSYVGRE